MWCVYHVNVGQMWHICEAQFSRIYCHWLWPMPYFTVVWDTAEVIWVLLVIDSLRSHIYALIGLKHPFQATLTLCRKIIIINIAMLMIMLTLMVVMKKFTVYLIAYKYIIEWKPTLQLGYFSKISCEGTIPNLFAMLILTTVRGKSWVVD